nr:MAG TPA: hypothetical protein [Caudoviricetes sp.]
MCALTISRLSVARVAKLVDALASGASAFTGVLVRVQSRAPKTISDLADLRGFLLRLRNSCCRILNPIFLN